MVQLAGSTAHLRPPRGPAQTSPNGGVGGGFAPALAGVLVLLAITGGCRSRAYQDVYTQKLTGEIRALEDRLNEADYTNQVLRQKLARYEARQTAERSSSRVGMDETPEDGVEADAEGDLNIRIDQNRGVLPSDGDADPAADMELDIDLGEPTDPRDASPDQDAPAAADDLPAPGDSLPPVQPLPPRATEFEMPPIELGEPLPPGEPDDDAELPPGQIPTPESARMLFPATPAEVAIHTGLSGRHYEDSDATEDGLYLVLTVADADGRPIRCEEAISIVVLDPAQTGEAARLGRWNFSAKEVAEHFRASPVPSIQLPILWQEARPAGDSVAVFVRVMTDTEQPLETDMLMEFQAGSGAEWTSRGLGTPESRNQSAQQYSADINPENAWK